MLVKSEILLRYKIIKSNSNNEFDAFHANTNRGSLFHL